MGRPFPLESRSWPISRSHAVMREPALGGKRPLIASPSAHSARRARPGGGAATPPASEQSASPGRGQRAPRPPPRARLPTPLTARSSRGWAPALRPPPCSRGTDGSRPAGPPAALARPHPGASLKRPRTRARPERLARGAFLILQQRLLKIERCGGARGAGLAPRPCRPGLHPRSRTRSPWSHGHPRRVPGTRQGARARPPNGAGTAAGTAAYAPPAWAPCAYPDLTRGSRELALRWTQKGNSPGLL